MVVQKREDTWDAMLAELSASGLRVAEFARQRGVSASRLYKHRRRVRAREVDATEDARKFVPVRVVDAGPESGAQDCFLKVVTRNGLSIEARMAVESEALLSFVRGVLASC